MQENAAPNSRDPGPTKEVLKWLVADAAHLAALQARYCTDGGMLVDDGGDDNLLVHVAGADLLSQVGRRGHLSPTHPDQQKGT